MGKPFVVLHVDTSELTGPIENMRAVHTEKEFQQLMGRAFRRTAPRVRTILRREVPQDYEARPSWIAKQVKSAQTLVGSEVTCTIPIEGARGRIGRGDVYKATAKGAEGAGVRKGYSGRAGKRTRRAYKINAQIVKSETSVLPGRESKKVHFMVFTGPYKGKVFARLSDDRDDIRPATGIGVPQMPTNRSRKAVQDSIVDLLRERIEHEHTVLIRGLDRR